jgi:predicted permease
VLLLIRSQERERDVWVRRALGAGRLRVARLVSFEALALAAGAGVLGVALAASVLELAGGPIQVSLGRPVPGGPSALRLDGFAVGTAMVLTTLTAAAFTLLPLLGALRRWDAPAPVSARGATAGRTRTRLRVALVTAEIALSTTLLVAGALALRSARHLATVDLGFDPENVYVANLLFPARAYPDAGDRAELYARLAEEARDLPGVESVGVSALAPFRWTSAPRPVQAEEGAGAAVLPLSATRLVVGGGWLETMRVRLVSGRTLRDDSPGAEAEAVVSEALARSLWKGTDPIGRRLRLLPESGADPGNEPAAWHTVVGVVADIRGTLEGSAPPVVYLPLSRFGSNSVTAVVRVREGAADPLPALRQVLGEIEPALATYDTGWLSDSISDAGRASRLLASFLGGFSAFAVGLSVVGLYAVLAFAAAQRRRDIAIRMSLGARGASVTRLFVAEGMKLAAVGVALGAVGAALLAARISEQLHGVSPMDGGSYAASAALLLLVAAAAVWIPSRRAARVDPMEVLREE